MTDKKKPVELSDKDLNQVAGTGFTGGVFVATGDVSGDGVPVVDISLNFEEVKFGY